MHNDDTPRIHSFNYASSRTAGGIVPVTSSNLSQQVMRQPYRHDPGEGWREQFPLRQLDDGSRQFIAPVKKDTKMNIRRMVQMYVVDPDEQVPLDKSTLYKCDPFLTDLTDQELWYGINLPNLLKGHNDYRITLVNKKVKERTEFLEVIRIKDLSMLVVTLAEFK